QDGADHRFGEEHAGDKLDASDVRAGSRSHKTDARGAAVEQDALGVDLAVLGGVDLGHAVAVFVGHANQCTELILVSVMPGEISAAVDELDDRPLAYARAAGPMVPRPGVAGPAGTGTESGRAT